MGLATLQHILYTPPQNRENVICFLKSLPNSMLLCLKQVKEHSVVLFIG